MKEKKALVSLCLRRSSHFWRRAKTASCPTSTEDLSGVGVEVSGDPKGEVPTPEDLVEDVNDVRDEDGRPWGEDTAPACDDEGVAGKMMRTSTSRVPSQS